MYLSPWVSWLYMKDRLLPEKSSPVCQLAFSCSGGAGVALTLLTRARAAFHTYLKELIDAGFGKRIMFGSDQMVWPDAIGLAINGVDQAPFLSPEQKRAIFYNNAAVFLRLDQETIDRHHRK